MYGSQIPNVHIANNKSANEEHWPIESTLASCSGEVAHVAKTQQCPHAADEPWYNRTTPNLELGKNDNGIEEHQTTEKYDSQKHRTSQKHNANNATGKDEISDDM